MQLLLTLLSIVLLCVLSTIIVGNSKKLKTFLLVAFLGVTVGAFYNKVKAQERDETVIESTIDNCTVNNYVNYATPLYNYETTDTCDNYSIVCNPTITEVNNSNTVIPVQNEDLVNVDSMQLHLDTS